MTESMESLVDQAEAAQKRKMASIGEQRYEDAAKHRDEERRLLEIIKTRTRALIGDPTSQTTGSLT